MTRTLKLCAVAVLLVGARCGPPTPAGAVWKDIQTDLLGRCALVPACHGATSKQVLKIDSAVGEFVNFLSARAHINRSDPPRSVLLLKARDQLTHSGGRILYEGDPAYRTWLYWIIDGMPPYGDMNVCVSSECASGSQCSSPTGRCISFQCSDMIKCTDASMLCDPYVHQCYPSSGSCGTVADCPRFDGKSGPALGLACEQGACTVKAARHRLPGTEELPVIQVRAPTPGMSFGMAAPAFRWDATDGTAIALVLGAAPDGLDDLSQKAIWGFVAAAGQTTAAWGDGSAIRNGQWEARTPPVPAQGPLYLLVQSVRTGRLLAVSDLIPFQTTGSFPVKGDACTPATTRPGACENPMLPLGCFLNRCEILCASHRDCVPYGLSCGPVEEGFRHCI